MKSTWLFTVLLLLSISSAKYSYSDECYRFKGKGTSYSIIMLYICNYSEILLPILC